MLRIRARWTLMIVLPLVASVAVAQDEAPEMSPEMQEMMKAWTAAGKTGEPHEALSEAVGNWKMTIRSWGVPGAEPMVSEGTAKKVMALGGRVLEEHIESDMMGQPFTGLARSGYDNVTKKHWATWTDSMSTGIYVSYGTADESGTLTYRGDYVDPMTGETVKIRSVVRWIDDDNHAFDWYEDRGEGDVKTMEITYERQGE